MNALAGNRDRAVELRKTREPYFQAIGTRRQPDELETTCGVAAHLVFRPTLLVREHECRARQDAVAWVDDRAGERREVLGENVDGTDTHGEQAGYREHASFREPPW